MIGLTVRGARNISISSELLKGEPQSKTPLNKAVARRRYEKGNYAYVEYSLPDLQPQGRMLIGEPLSLSETRLSGIVPTSPGKGLSYEVTYAFHVMVSASAKDVPVSDYNIEVFGVQASEWPGPLVEILRNLEGRDNLIRDITPLSFYLTGIILAPQQVDFILAPPLRQLDTGVGILQEQDHFVDAYAMRRSLYTARRIVPFYRLQNR